MHARASAETGTSRPAGRARRRVDHHRGPPPGARDGEREIVDRLHAGMAHLLERQVGKLRLGLSEAGRGLTSRVGDDVQLDGGVVGHRREATAAVRPPVSASRSAGASSSSSPRLPALTWIVSNASADSSTTVGSAPLPERADPARDVSGRTLRGPPRRPCARFRARAGRAAHVGTTATVSAPSTSATRVLNTRSASSPGFSTASGPWESDRGSCSYSCTRNAMPARSAAASPVSPSPPSRMAQDGDPALATEVDGQDRLVIAVGEASSFRRPRSTVGSGRATTTATTASLLKDNVRRAGSRRWCASETTSSRSTRRSSSTPGCGRRPGTSAASPIPSSTAARARALPRRPPRGPEHTGFAVAGGRASGPGGDLDTNLTEPRHFNLMFRTQVGAVKGTGVDVASAPRRHRGSSSTSRTSPSSLAASPRSASPRSARPSGTRSHRGISSSGHSSSR